MDFSAPLDARGTGVVQTKIRAEKNSLLRLVQVQRVGEGFTFFNDMSAVCSEGARVELVQLVLSGEQSYTGCQVQLSGNRSKTGVESEYLI